MIDVTGSAKRNDLEAKGNVLNAVRHTLKNRELDRQTPGNTRDVVAKLQEVVEAGLAEEEGKNVQAIPVVL
jgi:hypothetical protein